MSSRVYKWKGDADAAGIFKCDASAPVCEREADAEGTYKRKADAVIHKRAVIFFFIM
ncbi:20350_t:CDS:2, partial [Rhizophagus irregularis]